MTLENKDRFEKQTFVKQESRDVFQEVNTYVKNSRTLHLESLSAKTSFSLIHKHSAKKYVNNKIWTLNMDYDISQNIKILHKILYCKWS